MTTDNRTNEPNEAQVEAALAAHAAHKGAWVDEFKEMVCPECGWCYMTADERKPDSKPSNEVVYARVDAHRMRAALVAAAGATPSVGIRALAEAEVRKSAAEGNPICEPGVTKDIAFIRGAVFGAAQGAAPQAEGECDNHRPVQHRDGKPPWCNACGQGRPVLPSTDSLLATFADWHERWWRNEPNTIAKANAQAAFFAGWDARGAAPVPSSTVDVAKIESLILGRTATAGARAVAEWFKEQGR